VTRDELVTAVRALLADRLALKVERVTLRSRLIDDLGADSLDFIDLVFTLEKKFGIKIREEEFDFLAARLLLPRGHAGRLSDRGDGREVADPAAGSR